jgi:hypothetical protein
MMTAEQKIKFANALAGTADSVERAVEMIGLDPDDFEPDDLEVIAAEQGYERCEECDWWCETGELVDDDGEVVPCESCRPRLQED